MTDQITPSQFHEAEGVESARFVQAIGDLQGAEDHRPGIDVRHDLFMGIQKRRIDALSRGQCRRQFHPQ
jgi:hypothetical protein